MMKMYVLIPAYNEEKTLPALLESLARQSYDGLQPAQGLPKICLIDNCSTDNTVEIFQQKACEYGFDYVVVKASTKGIVETRKRGVEYVLSETKQQEWGEVILAFVDADVRLSSDWVGENREYHSRGFNLLTSLGFFYDEFWTSVPLFARREWEMVGDMFFSDRVARQIQLPPANRYSKQIYRDFYKPPADTCFSLRLDFYVACGGYKRYFDKHGNEIFGETWNLLMNVVKTKRFRSCVLPRAFYEASPRRLVVEAMKFIKDESYKESMGDVRDELTREMLQKFEREMADKDMGHLRDYVLKYYVFLPCVFDDLLIDECGDYFRCIDVEKLKSDIAHIRRLKNLQVVIEDELHGLLERYGEGVNRFLCLCN